MAKGDLLFSLVGILTLNPGEMTKKYKDFKKKYIKVTFGKSGTYKSKFTLEPLLSQNRMHFT